MGEFFNTTAPCSIGEYQSPGISAYLPFPRTAGDIASDIATIVRAIYIGLDPRLTNAAGFSVLAHMEDLAARGEVATDGLPSISGVYRLAGS